MRLWVHVIWLKKNPKTPLALCGPKEDRKLEYLISQWDEFKVAYAWYLYVNAKPSPYNLRPVTHVDKFTTAKGNIMATKVRDTSAITRFPLSAFLAVQSGFMVQSCLHIDALNKGVEQANGESEKLAGGGGTAGRSVASGPKMKFRYAAEILGISGYEFEEEILPGMQATYKAINATTASVKQAWGVTQKDLEDDDDF